MRSEGHLRRSTQTPLTLLLLLAATQPAWAHVQQGQAAGFLTGMKHPISGLDHVGLHGAGIAISLVHRWNWGRLALRVAGAAVAMAGLSFLWRAIG